MEQTSIFHKQTWEIFGTNNSKPKRETLNEIWLAKPTHFLKSSPKKECFPSLLTENHPWRNKTHTFDISFVAVSLFLQTHLKGLTLRNARRQNLEIRASPKKKRRPLPTEKCHGEHRSDTRGWPSRFKCSVWGLLVDVVCERKIAYIIENPPEIITFCFKSFWNHIPL